MWVIWEKISQEFDIHLSQYHSLYPLSTLSFTDKALMLFLPSTCIWIACHRRQKLKLKKKKKLSISHPLSLHLSFPPSPLYQLEQVIITLTAFSVFTLSLNLSSRAACCANQLHGAPRHFNLLSSARLHTGADWRMQTGCRSTSHCQDSYLSQSCQRCDWQPVTGSAHLLPLPSPRLGLNLPQGSGRADMTSVLRGHAQGISAADDTVTSSANGCVLSVMTHREGLCGCGVGWDGISATAGMRFIRKFTSWIGY